MSKPTFGIENLEGANGTFWYEHECSIKNVHGETRRHVILPLDDGTNGWQLIQEEPLTITPSILCYGCQHHGFITNGGWVAA